MKKTMIIALLAVLVLGAFTACNGDVNAELAGSRTITLEIVDIYEDDWKFNNGTKTLVVTIPEGCETWGDLVGKISITIMDGNTTKTLPLISAGTAPDDDVRFYVDDYYGSVKPNAKWSPTMTVKRNTSIALGKTYELHIQNAPQ